MSMTCISVYILHFICLGGGLAAVIYIDVVQVTIMIAGSSILLYRGLDKVGGWEQLQTKQVHIFSHTHIDFLVVP